MEEIKMNFQNEINNDIKFLAQSEIRLKILSELNKKPDNIRGLVKRTENTYSSISSNLAKLEHNNHIKKVNNKYHHKIREMNSIINANMAQYVGGMEIIQQFEKELMGIYVTSHPLGSIKDTLKYITTQTISDILEADNPYNSLKSLISSGKGMPYFTRY